MWECDEYLPASFMLRDELEDASTDHITHMATFSFLSGSRPLF